jgi:hypothetical protein
MTPTPPFRPRDLAVLILASGDLLPRRRARTQEPDIAGMALKRRILDRLAALDPEPDVAEMALQQIVDEIGPPTGPTRAIAVSILEEWRAVCDSPEFLAHLVGEAAMQNDERKRRGR